MNPWLKRYYFLAPVWFLLEAFLWKGLRAGPVVGHSTGAVAAFYAVEGAIGYGLWAGRPAAIPAALAENVGQLAMTMRYIMYTPLDIASDIESPDAPARADDYAKSIPGAIFSGFQLVIALRRKLGSPGPI